MACYQQCKLGDVRVEAVNRMLNIVHVCEASHAYAQKKKKASHADPSELLFP
jgi:hypothetical protein